MTSVRPALPGAEPFFLPGPRGPLFALYHAPAGPCRQALLYVHPFAEEMNRSRRTAALAARRLAASGVAVLQLDLYGCGDSAGEFADARWEGWLDDLAAGQAWLYARTGQAPGLWGLRLGALLALAHASRSPEPVARLLLWQPVTSGATFLAQFLRLRSAGDMLRGGETRGTQALRTVLAQGATLEIAGYALAPQLAAAIESADAAMLIPKVRVDWFDLGAPGRAPAPPRERIAAAWRATGASATLHMVEGPEFWASQEITLAPALIDATAVLLEEAIDG